MKKKRLAALSVALVFIFSCGFSVIAFNISFSDFLGVLDSVDFGAFPSYNETAWNDLTLDERRSILETPIKTFKGVSHLDDDFLNSSQSYNYYCSLIRSGNSADFVTAPISTVYGEIMLERSGQADFGLGFYSKNGHSSGKFGDGTVADTLNNDFLDYYQNKPFVGNSSSPQFEFSNGYYLVFEYVTYGGGYTHKIDGVSHTKQGYKPRFLLYDNTGTMVQVYNPSSFVPSYICDKRDDIPFFDITFTENGKYYYYYYGGLYDCPPIASKSPLYDIPFYSKYGTPTEKTDDIFAVGFNDNGDKIDIQLNSDGITYEGDTYTIDNSDHSVIINGDKYYITVDPSTVDDDYYNQFLKDTINNYYNYYTTNNTDFDDTDIITSLKSIFTSLERFRDDFYSNIRQISNSISTGFVSLKNSLSDMSKKLDTIISQLKNINKELGELSEDQQEENKLAWAELIDSFKNKVGWSALSQSMTNISTAFFGEREYTVTTSGAVSVDIATSDGVVSSSMPSLYFEYGGVKYDIFSCLGYLGSGIDTIKSFISVFLWIGFIISVYRSIPSIIGGVASFDDHSNNVVVDKTTGEVKRGA